MKVIKYISKFYQRYLRSKKLRFFVSFTILFPSLYNILSGHLIKALIFGIIYFIWKKWFCFPYKRRNVLNMVFGAPGSGKTSFLCFLTLRARALGIDVYSNVPIKDTYKFNWKDDYGEYLIENGVIMIDESALEDGLNNREFTTNFSRKNGMFRKLECLKLHRHFKQEIYLFSQSPTDTDKYTRDLTQSFWLCKKVFSWLIHVKLYITDVDIDPMTQDFRLIRKKVHDYFIFTPVCWLFFDTEEVPFELKEKEFLLR